MSPFGVKYGIAAGAETIVGIDRHPQPDLQLHDKLWRIESKAQYLRRDRRQETAGASQALGIEIRLLRHCAGGKLTPKFRLIDSLGNRFLAQSRREFRRQLLVDVQGGVDSTKGSGGRGVWGMDLPREVPINLLAASPGRSARGKVRAKGVISRGAQAKPRSFKILLLCYYYIILSR